MTVVKVLQEARALIAQGWTQGWFAKKQGLECGASAEGADCWCVIGALERAERLGVAAHTQVTVEALRALVDALEIPNFHLQWDSLAHWNDAPGRTQGEVLAMFDKAIAAEEAKA